MKGLVVVINGKTNSATEHVASLERMCTLIAPDAEHAFRGLRLLSPDVIILQLSASGDEELRLISGLREASGRPRLLAVAAEHSRDLEMRTRQAGATCYFAGSDVDLMTDLLRGLCRGASP